MDALSKNTNFFRKIFYAATFAIIIVAVGLALLFVRDQSRTLTNGLKKQGEILALMLAYNGRLGVFTENSDLFRDPLEGLLQNKEVIAVTVVTAEGKILDYREKLHHTGRIDREEMQMAVKTLQTNQFHVVEEEDSVACWAPVRAGSSPKADETFFLPVMPAPQGENIIGYIRVLLTREHLEEKLHNLVLHSILLTAALLLVGTGILYVVIKNVVTPLNRLTGEVIAYGKGQHQGPVKVETRDEIGELAAAFNTMTEALAIREEEKRKLEEQLRHSSKMEAIGTLAGGVAHDFNNILTAMVGYINVLGKSLPDDSSKLYLDRMRAITTRAAGITKRLLALGRSDAVTLRAANLNELIRGEEEMLCRVAGENLKTEFLLSPEPVIVMADPAKLEQVLLNLVTNARDASPDGGLLTVAVGRKEVGEELLQGLDHARPGSYGTIMVKDTGSGIREEIKDRIFDPFFTTKEVDKGTGLGLSMVYGIVKKHSGFVTVESEIGRGTSFTIHLPIAYVLDNPDK